MGHSEVLVNWSGAFEARYVEFGHKTDFLKPNKWQENDAFFSFSSREKTSKYDHKIGHIKRFHPYNIYCNVTRYHKYKCPGDHYETVSPMILDKGWGVGLLFHFIWVFSGIYDVRDMNLVQPHKTPVA